MRGNTYPISPDNLPKHSTSNKFLHLTRFNELKTDCVWKRSSDAGFELSTQLMEYSNIHIPTFSTHVGIIFQQFPRNVGIPGGRFDGIFHQNIPTISTVSEYSNNDSIRKERVNIQLDDLRRAAAGPRGRNLTFTLYFVLCTACRGCVEGPASTWRLAKSRGRAPPEEPYFYFLLCTLHRLQMEYSNIYSIRKASAILLESMLEYSIMRGNW